MRINPWVTFNRLNNIEFFYQSNQQDNYEPQFCFTLYSKGIKHSIQKRKAKQLEKISHEQINLSQSIQVSLVKISTLPPKTDEFRKCQTATRGREASIVKRGRPPMKITDCPHTSRRHYAKGMCMTCYNERGRPNRVYICLHMSRQVDETGMCQKCYREWYSKLDGDQDSTEKVDDAKRK